MIDGPPYIRNVTPSDQFWFGVATAAAVQIAAALVIILCLKFLL